MEIGVFGLENRFYNEVKQLEKQSENDLQLHEWVYVKDVVVQPGDVNSVQDIF